MGHASKKKKKGGGSGRRSKGRAQLKDHTSDNGGDNELLSEEITALCAIFQDDFKIDQGSPPQIIIKLRPYSKDMGYEDLDVSARLLVRCLPGYPYKCPKLQIIPEKGLTKSDADNLLCLLQDQANSNAREGLVMIFNLVEAAQEFLSEIIPVGRSIESDLCSNVGSSSQMLQDIAVSTNKSCSSRGPFVYGFVDLFSGSGESWHWSLGMDENRGIVSSVQSHTSDGSKLGYEVLAKKIDKNVKPVTVQDTKQGPVLYNTAKLDAVKEETEDENKSISTTDSSRSVMEELVGNALEDENEDIFLWEHVAEEDDSDLEIEPSKSWSSVSLGQDQASQNVKKDIIVAHLLRLACASKGPLADALPQISTELYNLGIFSESVRDLASKPSSLFNQTFDNVFHQHMSSSRVSQFWKPASDFGGTTTSLPSSRYLNDFEELQPLGHGGFGHVVLCKNKLDGRQYAVKKIRLKDKSLPVNDRILREVATLSRLQHQHVVRYYQAWYETGVADPDGDSAWGSGTAASSAFSYRAASSADVSGQDNKLETTYLYIQMEYCPRTLRQVFESYNHFDKELAWHLFRQIVEGLVHIHGQGIIHRDLTPSNIFFDARNDIKIGDFGLAKFLKLEQLDQDAGFLTDTTGISADGTGQVGTYFYTAPEIEQGWPKIDEKADMYSLGVVFFELWHPFGTAMERHIVLSDLKQKGELPPAWLAEFPEQASLLRRLMSPSPSDRPSATELLQNAFPPRMEYELLDNVLRMMQTSEDTSIYDKVVSSIFDKEMIGMESSYQHAGVLTVTGDNASSIQYTDLDTELRDYVIEATREVFRQRCAKHLETIPMYLLGDCPQLKRNTVKLLTRGGDMLELCHELRLPFVCWAIANQKSSFKRYEISFVYRRAIGHSPPNRYLQGDFDIIGGASALTEAEVLKMFRALQEQMQNLTAIVEQAINIRGNGIRNDIEHRDRAGDEINLVSERENHSASDEFDGDMEAEEFLDWVDNIETYFDWKEVLEERKVKLEIRGKGKVRSWDKMKEKLKAQFLPRDYEEAYQRVQNLRQREKTVKEYMQKFHIITLRSNLVETETQHVGRYVNGLRLTIQDQVSLHHQCKVSDAYQLALKVKAALNRGSSKKFGAECSRDATSKANNSTRGGRTTAPARPNVTGGSVT
ncbi:hypothetical protein JRO89_XS03G0017900 [Xanthoceras sorbifolium]|uniref:non-specific serine/threonine protein kinase n=1 Tax=Xanthoceras sorbifolium TaxID=99658 RepID=A0ABQ8I850_9ROSI|nr:hypothetical protein JRO89_XS03G0017900 [Xanthoceras sorbifolium]